MNSKIQALQNISHYIQTQPQSLFFQQALRRIQTKMDPLNHSPINLSNSKVIMVMHQGLGDMITIIGIIRYLSVCYDKVVVVAHPRNFMNVKNMYLDDNTIEVVSVPIDCKEPWGSANLDFLAPYYRQGYRVILGPCFAPQQKWKFIHYKQFYYDVGLDYAQTRFKFSYMYRNREKELQLFRDEGLENIPYVFVHDESLVPKIKTLTNMKIYCPKGAGNMLDYCTIIERAHAIHIKDSSFFCLTTILDTSQVKSKFVYQRQGDVIYTDYPKPDDKWNFILPPPTKPTKPKRRVFRLRSSNLISQTPKSFQNIKPSKSRSFPIRSHQSRKNIAKPIQFNLSLRQTFSRRNNTPSRRNNSFSQNIKRRHIFKRSMFLRRTRNR